jgi:CheY-like chemotaxis protein
LSSSPRVLIVDESAESRDIICTLLQRHGATTFEAQRLELAVQLANLHQPDLILLDAESDRGTSGAATDDLRAVAERSDTPVVILGTLTRCRGRFPNGQFVAKPYHYGPLIRKIEGLLGAVESPSQAYPRSIGA